MNTQLKTMLALVLFLAVSNQVLAKNKPPGDGERPQRPSFASINTNDDDVIDFEEFSVQELPFDHQTFFDSIDTDGNGTISEEEFENHKPPRRQK